VYVYNTNTNTHALVNDNDNHSSYYSLSEYYVRSLVLGATHECEYA